MHPTVVFLFWSFVGLLLRLETWRLTLFSSPKIKSSIAITLPRETIMHDKRPVVAVLPKEYYPNIVNGKIVPIHGQLSRLNENSVTLVDGTNLPCDICVLSLGNQTPSFPFLPEKYRLLMEREGGTQLFRHLIHPRIPRIGFVGFNHSFLHAASIELGTLWLHATISGELALPSVEVNIIHILI
jgi:hypothetical protein